MGHMGSPARFFNQQHREDKVLPGETCGLTGTTCSDCGQGLDLDVLHSNAGYYLGYFCSECGPFSRETGYYTTEAEAYVDLLKVKRGEDITTVRT